jgi:hypothetical protein
MTEDRSDCMGTLLGTRTKDVSYNLDGPALETLERRCSVKTCLRMCLLLVAGVAFANSAWAQTCPATVYLANNASTADGMRSNGGYIAFTLGTSTTTGSGRTCTYTRPADPNYDPFIGRNLAADELSAAPTGTNAWQVVTAGGGFRTVTCPTGIEIGPLATYAMAGGSMTPLPEGWLVTQNNVQALVFNTRSNQPPFALRCNYRLTTIVELYVSPPTRSFSASSCAGLYTGTSLSARLAACPGLDDLLIWQDGAGHVFSHSGYSYPAWTRAQRDRLDQLFQMMQDGEAALGLDCPSPAANLWAAGQSNSASGTPVRGELLTQIFFTANQAFDTYAAHVAWSLYLEVNHVVPWSLLNHPSSELVEFFDSRRYHTRFPARDAVYASGYANRASYPTAIEEGRDFWNATSRLSAGWEAVCDPRVAYEFLSGGPNSSSRMNLLGATEMATLKNLTWWFYNDVAHGDARDAATSAVLRTPSVFLSNRLIARSDTFFTPPSQPLVIANAGCHSAANLFYDLAKGVNIPVLHVASTHPGGYAAYPLPPVYIDFGRHSGLVYGWGSPSTTLFLQHTDDIYAQHGLIFPVDSMNRPVADQADALFAAAWLRPTSLTVWGYTVTNDFGLQNPFSTYGNPYEREVESQGVLAGYWTPSGTLGNANTDRFLWFTEAQLCSFGGGHNVMWNCLNSDPTVLRSNWLSGFGQTVLQAPGGGTSTTPQLYINHLQACAVAATGLPAAVSACASFAGPGNVYSMRQQNRTATSSWVGAGGR